MIIAAAQLNASIGNIQQNLEAHYKLIKMAITAKAQLVTFPEMSMTAYCREEGKKYAFAPQDKRLNKLQELANLGNITIIAGAPITLENQLYIGSFIIQPNAPIQSYTKQYLHGKEALFYKASKDYNPILNLSTEKIGFAICADLNNEAHPCAAASNGTTLYIPSIFYSEESMGKAHNQLAGYAKKYCMNVLMANYSGHLWGMKAGGKSAFYAKNGDLIGQLKSADIGLLIAEKKDNCWSVTKKTTH